MLRKLSFSHYIFSIMDNGAYDQLIIPNPIDMANIEDRRRLIDWLRRWGVRGLAHNNDNHLLPALLGWYNQNNQNLPGVEIFIQDLQGNNLEQIGAAFDALCGINRIGLTGAAKILFALRPNSLPAWDQAIYRRLTENNSIEGRNHNLYLSFIEYVNALKAQLDQECRQAGFQLTELPARIYPIKENYSILKLIDEYLWTTITKGIEFPQNEIIQQWTNWP